MSNSLINICYDGESGRSEIRTATFDDTLYVSLNDILLTINKENQQLDDKNPRTALMNLVKGQMGIIDSDEMIMLPIPGEGDSQQEVFVTEPGLYRVMASNKSKAGKKFQRWLFHDVIPSIVKHGSYPPPITSQEGKASTLVQMAEMLAQNSRALADSIIEQEKIKSDVSNLKNSLDDLGGRLSSLESNSVSIGMLTVEEFLERRSLVANLVDFVAWCENIAFRENSSVIKSDCGERLKARYQEAVLEKAYTFTASQK
ncbi:Bro-N domain-containing protein [Bacterioplanoides sp.]|uniref:BRO-N domain-containing protein n=1 Tax=Bacterioplanoides sp. TaxID=2066072 RepID=UPI003B5CCBC9